MAAAFAPVCAVKGGRGRGDPLRMALSSQGEESKPFGKANERRKQRPPLNYTEQFTAPEKVTMDVIGVVKSPYKERFGTPRQATVSAQTLGNAAQDGEIHLAAGMNLEHALRGLERFDYCWAICWMHLNTGWNPLITSIDHTRRIIHVKGLDLLDGTPVIDIKPYVPYADAFPDAAAGWLDDLQDMKGPDHLTYFPPPPHLRPQPPQEADRTGSEMTEDKEADLQASMDVAENLPDANEGLQNT